MDCAFYGATSLWNIPGFVLGFSKLLVDFLITMHACHFAIKYIESLWQLLSTHRVLNWRLSAGWTPRSRVNTPQETDESRKTSRSRYPSRFKKTATVENNKARLLNKIKPHWTFGFWSVNRSSIESVSSSTRSAAKNVITEYIDGCWSFSRK